MKKLTAEQALELTEESTAWMERRARQEPRARKLELAREAWAYSQALIEERPKTLHAIELLRELRAAHEELSMANVACVHGDAGANERLLAAGDRIVRADRAAAELLGEPVRHDSVPVDELLGTNILKCYPWVPAEEAMRRAAGEAVLVLQRVLRHWCGPAPGDLQDAVKEAAAELLLHGATPSCPECGRVGPHEEHCPRRPGSDDSRWVDGPDGTRFKIRRLPTADEVYGILSGTSGAHGAAAPEEVAAPPTGTPERVLWEGENAAGDRYRVVGRPDQGSTAWAIESLHPSGEWLGVSYGPDADGPECAAVAATALLQTELG